MYMAGRPTARPFVDDGAGPASAAGGGERGLTRGGDRRRGARDLVRSVVRGLACGRGAGGVGGGRLFSAKT